MAKKKIDYREWLRELGMRNASKMLDLHYETIRFYCNGYGDPTMKTARRILKASNGRVDPGSFLTEVR